MGEQLTRAEYGVARDYAGQCVVEMPQQNVGQLAAGGRYLQLRRSAFTLYDCIVDQVNTGTSQNGISRRLSSSIAAGGGIR